jgi:hypothetical protein
MDRRVPSLEKARRLVGYRPRRSLEDCIRDTAKALRIELGLAGDKGTGRLKSGGLRNVKRRAKT